MRARHGCRFPSRQMRGKVLAPVEFLRKPEEDRFLEIKFRQPQKNLLECSFQNVSLLFRYVTKSV
jgi:hypothetical protein